MGDGEGLRHLAPDQLITVTPRALVAEVAKVAELAKVAEKVGNGAITRDMLSSEVLSQLDANATASPSAPVTITRDMLPQDVRDDLNKTITITRSMLPADVLSDLNRTISKSMLGSDVLADLNKSSSSSSPITLSMLAPEVTAKLDQNITIGASSITKSMLAQEVLNDLNGSGGNTTINNPPAVGSTLAVPNGESAPAGYSLYHQVGHPKELVWEEKATVSIARGVYDGVEYLNDKIYLVGGRNFHDEINYNTSERYNPINNTWETIASMSSERGGIAAATFLNKLYAIGGRNSSNNYLSSVEIFDPSTDAWISGPSLPNPVAYASAIIGNGILYLVGGVNSSGNDLDQILKLDSDSGVWTALNQMPTAKHNFSSVWYKDRIWVIGGKNGETKLNTVESYDPVTNSWNIETPILQNRLNPVSWVHSDYIYVGGGHSGLYLNSIEFYDPVTKQWSSAGNFPENKFVADAVVLNDTIYVISGLSASGVYSNKVFAADLNASVEGVYDLYRKDGNASAGTPMVQAEVADGSVTASKMANNSITTTQLSEQILKYLKPEITSQPIGKIVYEDSNASFSVAAEGKYLTYQWKKDGVDLAGETNATLTITDANATQYDGNYSVVVSNDFGSVESNVTNFTVVNEINAISGLVGWWKFDETNGTIANDSSGYERHANMIGFDSNQSYWTSGKIGGSLTFDGVNDYAEVQGFYGINGLNPRTISAWIKTDSNNSNIMGWGRSSAGKEWKLSISNGKFRTSVWSGGVFGSNAADINDWVYIASILPSESSASSQIMHYFNGNLEILEIQEFSIFTGNDYTIKIGTNMNAGGKMNGAIDDLRLYDRALSAAEVQALYNLGQ
jgi:N-acetylneuraminic acid mutarotase